MKINQNLLGELRKEYINLQNRIAIDGFALNTLNISTQEHELLKCQLQAMQDYARYLLQRCVIIKDRLDNENKTNTSEK
jgi:hypothetical protein